MNLEYGMDLFFNFILLLFVVFCFFYTHKHKAIFYQNMKQIVKDYGNSGKENVNIFLTKKFIISALPLFFLCASYVVVGAYRLVLFFFHFQALNIVTWLLICTVSLISLYVLLRAITTRAFLHVKHGA